MADIYVKRPWHYEAIANIPENEERLRELSFDPIMMPAGVIVPFCVETGEVEYPLCADQEEFDLRYELEEVIVDE
jgi:hypothetical protein